MVERQARDLKVRGSNPGPGSNFSLEFKIVILQATNYRFVFIYQSDLEIYIYVCVCVRARACVCVCVCVRVCVCVCEMFHQLHKQLSVIILDLTTKGKVRIVLGVEIYCTYCDKNKRCSQAGWPA